MECQYIVGACRYIKISEEGKYCGYVHADFPTWKLPVSMVECSLEQMYLGRFSLKIDEFINSKVDSIHEQ